MDADGSIGSGRSRLMGNVNAECGIFGSEAITMHIQ